jgi:hypothetical protein
VYISRRFQGKALLLGFFKVPFFSSFLTRTFLKNVVCEVLYKWVLLRGGPPEAMNPRVFHLKRTQEYEHSPIQEPSQTSRQLTSTNQLVFLWEWGNIYKKEDLPLVCGPRVLLLV